MRGSVGGVRWQQVVGWLGILAGAAVFVVTLPLDDPALVMALGLTVRSGRLILAVDS